MGIEARLEELTCDRAKALGWEHRKLGWIGRRNAPDHFFGKQGVGSFLIEFKQPGEKPRKAQRKEIEFLRACGLEVHVIDNLKDAYELFEDPGRLA